MTLYCVASKPFADQYRLIDHDSLIKCMIQACGGGYTEVQTTRAFELISKVSEGERIHLSNLHIDKVE